MRIAKVSGDNIQIRDHTFFFPNTSFSKKDQMKLLSNNMDM